MRARAGSRAAEGLGTGRHHRQRRRRRCFRCSSLHNSASGALSASSANPYTNPTPNANPNPNFNLNPNPYPLDVYHCQVAQCRGSRTPPQSNGQRHARLAEVDTTLSHDGVSATSGSDTCGMPSAGLARNEEEAAPARSLRTKQWTAFSVFCERLQAALREEYPDTTAGCVLG